LLIAIAIFSIFTYTARYVLHLAPLYLDERLYLRCGVEYISGTPPELCNFEHPPLGKYIIGLFEILNAGFLLLVLDYLLSLVLIYKIVRVLTEDKTTSLYSTLIIGFDTLFMFTYMHFLLDPVALTFLLATLYVGIKEIKIKDTQTNYKHIILGVLVGLTLATKWQTAYTVIGLLIVLLGHWIRVSGVKSAASKFAALASVSAIAYLGTFIMDLKLGVTEPLHHNFMALSYMTYRHGFSFPLAMIGVIKLLSRVELWRLASFMILYVTTVQVAPNITSVLVINSTAVEPSAKAFVLVGIGVPSILWPVLFPLFLIALRDRLMKGVLKELDPIIIIAATSMINLLNGPLDWYYVYVIPFLYVITVRRVLLHRKGKLVITVMTLIQVIQSILFFSGVIPYAKELTI